MLQAATEEKYRFLLQAATYTQKLPVTRETYEMLTSAANLAWVAILSCAAYPALSCPAPATVPYSSGLRSPLTSCGASLTCAAMLTDPAPATPVTPVGLCYRKYSGRTRL